MKYSSKVKGFTLIELIIVIAIIAILMAVVLVALNPAKRFADSRNSRRQSDISSIVGAISQYTVNQAQLGTTVDYVAMSLPPFAGILPCTGLNSGTRNLQPYTAPANNAPVNPLQTALNLSSNSGGGGLPTIPTDPSNASNFYQVCYNSATQLTVSTTHMENSGGTNGTANYQAVSQ